MIYLKKILFINFLFTFLFAETGAKFLLISPGSKASSLANAQVANSMDAFASYWNPASLTNIKKTQFGFVHFKLFPNLSNDMYYNFIGFNHQFKKYGNIPHETIVKGDAKFLSIASASILAKHSRDVYMKKISKKFPNYFWFKNKGYPTKEHKEALKKYGITKHHRKSFKLFDEQLTIDF